VVVLDDQHARAAGVVRSHGADAAMPPSYCKERPGGVRLKITLRRLSLRLYPEAARAG
jgi:hypothetical protein